MTENGITLIDAGELPEDRIDESVARWRERVGLVHTAPGFRDARLPRRVSPESRLGLVNVAHWDSAEAWRTVADDPRFQQRLSSFPDFADANPGLFRIAAEF